MRNAAIQIHTMPRAVSPHHPCPAALALLHHRSRPSTLVYGAPLSNLQPAQYPPPSLPSCSGVTPSSQQAQHACLWCASRQHAARSIPPTILAQLLWRYSIIVAGPARLSTARASHLRWLAQLRCPPAANRQVGAVTGHRCLATTTTRHTSSSAALSGACSHARPHARVPVLLQQPGGSERKSFPRAEGHARAAPAAQP